MAALRNPVYNALMKGSYSNTRVSNLRAIVLRFPELNPVNLSRALGPCITSSIQWTIYFNGEDAQLTSTLYCGGVAEMWYITTRSRRHISWGQHNILLIRLVPRLIPTRNTWVIELDYEGMINSVSHLKSELTGAPGSAIRDHQRTSSERIWFVREQSPHLHVGLILLPGQYRKYPCSIRIWHDRSFFQSTRYPQESGQSISDREIRITFPKFPRARILLVTEIGGSCDTITQQYLS